ncbi:MAG: CHASE2 domain-containing protein [Rhodoferax sp.]
MSLGPRIARQLKRWTNVAAFVLVLSAVCAALALWLLDPVLMQNLRLAQFDQFQRWQPRAATKTQVRVVDIDDASLKAYGQWPWPRTRIAELVQRLQASGAAVVALDVLLTEPDQTSPKAMAQLWRVPKASAALQDLPDHDEVLARTLTASSVVLGGFLLDSSEALPSASPAIPVAPPYRIVRSGVGDPAQWLHRFDAAIWPLPALAANANGLGAINMASVDSDSVVRRVPLFVRLGEQIVPSLSAEALRVAQGELNHVLRSAQGGVDEVRIGRTPVPTNEQAEMWLYYSADQTERSVPAAQVLAGKLEPGQFKGSIVLVGSSAAGLFDLRRNPLGQLMPGVQAHALALEQILSNQYLERPHRAPAFEALALLFGVLLVGLVALAAPAWVSALLGAAVLTLLLGGVWYAFVAEHLLLDAVNPGLAILLSLGLNSTVHHFVSERERRWVREAFSRYVSPNRVAYLMQHQDQLQLGGQRQQCSFVFTDLADFTRLIEGRDPGQVTALLNDYLEAMLTIAFRHEGTLERIIGDALAVLFSAPVAQSDYRQRALDCALEMDAFASGYARRLQSQGVPWGHTRIGVHCGEVIVGNFGGKTLFDYRALGDPVNTASRLESVNKTLGTRVCVSQAILDGCPQAPVRAVGRLLLKGKKQPLRAFEPLAANDAAVCAAPADYAAAMQCLQSGDASQALPLFAALALRHPLDPLVALHLRRLQEGASDDLIVMSEK